jgi:protein-tyrosine phosphatase
MAFLPVVTSVLGGVVPGNAARIEDASCEMIGPGIYRLDYNAPPGTGPVVVWVSSRPDRIDSEKPLLSIKQPPAEVKVPSRAGRVYFHLKPADGLSRVVSIRRLPLEGAANFRDLGGYPSSDGRYLRWGLVYRSGQLADLTARDYQFLNSLSIRLVCDVRTEAERGRFPTRWIGQAPETVAVPIGQNRDASVRLEELRRRLASASAGGPYVATSSYNRDVIDFAGQYGVVLRRLAAGDLPAVEHCTAGKDRTGIFSAILLTALGVPRDLVIQDYLLTNRYLLGPDSIDKTAADLQRLLDLRQIPNRTAVEAFMTVRAEWLESAFVTIDTTYGSFRNYLDKGLRLSDSDLAMLKERLLEP